MVLVVNPRKVAFIERLPCVETDKIFFPATVAPHVLFTTWYVVLGSEVMEINGLPSLYCTEAVIPENEDDEYPADMRLSPAGESMTTLLQQSVIDDMDGMGRWRFRGVIVYEDGYNAVPLMVMFSHGIRTALVGMYPVHAYPSSSDVWPP